MEAELAALSRLTDDPAKPFVCAVGGAKIKDKIGMLERLSELVDAFCIGGGMGNTLLAARGVNVGTSLRDDDLEPARRILAAIEERRVDLHLPADAVVAPSVEAQDRAHVVPIEAVGEEMILDIGPASAQSYANAIEAAKTIVFNGPMGVYELTRVSPRNAGSRRCNRARDGNRSDQRRRRRRRRCGSALAGLRLENELRFDRRRRHAGVLGGQTTARSRRA